MAELIHPLPARVAVIDRDDSIVDAIAMFLQTYECHVRGYRTAEAFLQDLPSWLPVCLILDPDLPGQSGLDLITAIDPQQIRIIGLSARPSAPLSQEMLRAGASVVLGKPTTGEALIVTLQSIMAPIQ